MTNLRVVVVLGMRIPETGITSELKGRVDTGLELFQKGTFSRIVFSGGHTSRNAKSEADAMLKYGEKKGLIKTGTAILEEKSLDTLGNGILTEEILRSEGIHPDEIFVVTSCYHSRRSGYIFSRAFHDRAKIIVDSCYEVESGNAPLENEKMIEAEQFFAHFKKDYVEALQRTEIYRQKTV